MDFNEGLDFHASMTTYESHHNSTSPLAPVSELSTDNYFEAPFPGSTAMDISNSNGSSMPLTSSTPATNVTPESGVRITWWRLLNSVVVLVFGIVKSITSFQGSAIASNSFDVVLSVFWALM